MEDSKVLQRVDSERESSPLIGTMQSDRDGELKSKKFESALEGVGVGFFHFLLILVAGWALASDSVEVQCIAFVTPQLDNDPDLHPSKVAEGGLDAIIFLGMMVGGYFWGAWSDATGRRSSLLTSLTMNGIFGFLSAFSPSYAWFLIFRFFSGVGVGGSLPVAFAYFVEFFTDRNRGPFVIILAAFWVIGQIYTALLAWIVIGHYTAPTNSSLPPPPHTIHGELGSIHITSWRVYIMLCTIPCLTAALALLCMPESPSYLFTKGKVAKAVKVLRRIRSVNSVCARRRNTYDLSVLLEEDKEEESKKEEGTKYSCDSFSSSVLKFFGTTRDLFGRAYLRPTLVLLFIWFTLSFGYYGLMLWFPEYFKCVEELNNKCYYDRNDVCVNDRTPNSTLCTTASNIYLDSLYIALAAIPGTVLGVFTVNIIGARIMLTVSMIVSGLSTFLIWAVPKVERNIVILSGVFSGISIVGWNALDVLSTSELFPVHMRSTAIGVQQVLGRVGAIIGNLSFGKLITVSPFIPILLSAALLLAGGVSALLLPSPRGERMRRRLSRWCCALPSHFWRWRKRSEYTSISD